MTRTYTLKKRAESQAETRRRIVEAAVELHGSLGPARTTLSMIADRAGVQRHTLYAHFPDERSLAMACSGLHAERDPLPDAAPWRSIEDRQERLRVGVDAHVVKGRLCDNAIFLYDDLVALEITSLLVLLKILAGSEAT